MKIRIITALLTALVFTLQASEDNLIRDPEFKLQRKMWPLNAAATFKDGVVTLPLTNVRRNDPKTVTASIYQYIPAIKAGRYEFSAYYKGGFKNLFIVLRGYTKDKKRVDIISRWLDKKNFVKAGDKPGWNKFYYVGTVPANVVSASIHIEPWGSKGQTIQAAGIELAETE